MHLPTWFYYLVVAGFGLIFGSFFNVVIYRLPLEEGLGSRSHCTACGSQIKWYDNVPLVSFMVLRGRCRNCSEHISWRYPLVEFSTASLFVISYLWSSQAVPSMVTSASHPVVKGQAFVPELFIALVAVSVLVIATGTDIDHGIIPNVVTYAGIVVMTCLVTGLAIYRGQPARIGYSLLAAFLLGGLFLALSLIVGSMVFKRDGYIEEDEDDVLAGEGDLEFGTEAADEEDALLPPMGGGMGDVKLLFFLGLAVGYFHWYFAVLVLFFSALLGLIGVVVTRIGPWKERRKIRFAPYIAAGGLLTLFLGQQVVDLYIKLLS